MRIRHSSQRRSIGPSPSISMSRRAALWRTRSQAPGRVAGGAGVGRAGGEGVGGIGGELLEQAIGGVPVARAGVPAGGDPPAVALLGRIGAGEQALAERAVTVVVLAVAVGDLEQLDGV